MNLSFAALTRKYPMVHWIEAGKIRSVRWRSESGPPPPARVVVVDDQTSADAAYRLARNGTALLWRGDFQNARQLLQALTRRVEKRLHQPGAKATARSAVRLICGRPVPPPG